MNDRYISTEQTLECPGENRTEVIKEDPSARAPYHGKAMSMLRQDFAQYYNKQKGSKLKRIVVFLRSPGIYAVATFRFRHWLRHRPLLLRVFLAPFSVYLDHRMRSKWGIEIQSSATIGPGFVIYHYGGIFIAGQAVIGENFSIAHDVTIGSAGEGDREGVPVIGNNVAINPGAKLHGKIKIGDNVRIGPNAVVNKNVPDNALVHSRPMQVVTFPSFYGKIEK